MSEIKIANPGPLGLSGFALTTFILSLVNAGILSSSHVGIVIGLAVAYGGIAQFAAGMWEFRSGNTFGATAFSSYGAFWISFAVLVIGIGITKENAPDNTAVGYYLLAWGIFTVLMMLASFRTTMATALVFVLLAATFLVLAVGNFQNDTTIIGIGGYLGLATAIAAWYDALAGVLASLFGGKNVLPVIPLSRQ